MGEITRPRPRLVSWLSLLLVVVGAAGVVQLLAALLQQGYFTAGRREVALQAGAFAPELDRAVRTMEASVSLTIWLGVLGLLAFPVAGLAYGARTRARTVCWAFGIGVVAGQLLLMGGGFGQLYVDMAGDAAREDLVNTQLIHPLYRWGVFAAQVVTLIAAMAVFILSFHPEVVEFLKIRSEDPHDEAWERAVEVRRAATAVERED